MPDDEFPLLDAEVATWIQGGTVSIVVASSDAQGRPNVAAAVGCRVSRDRRRVTLLLLDTTSAAVLEDLATNDHVAVVFTESALPRSVQLKASGARRVPTKPGDRDRAAAYVGALARTWALAGQPEAWTRSLLPLTPGELVAIELAPDVAFDQTPGPRAGEALPLGDA